MRQTYQFSLNAAKNSDEGEDGERYKDAYKALQGPVEPYCLAHYREWYDKYLYARSGDGLNGVTRLGWPALTGFATHFLHRDLEPHEVELFFDLDDIKRNPPPEPKEETE